MTHRPEHGPDKQRPADCERAQDALIFRLANGASPSLRFDADLDSHLEQCERCQQEEWALREALDQYGEIPRPAAPNRILTNLLSEQTRLAAAASSDRHAGGASSDPFQRESGAPPEQPRSGNTNSPPRWAGRVALLAMSLCLFSTGMWLGNESAAHFTGAENAVPLAVDSLAIDSLLVPTSGSIFPDSL